MDFAAASMLGGLLGAVELIARYRDDPSLALKTAAAWLYILVNATASFIALWIVDAFQLSVPPVSRGGEFSGRVLTVLAASFGAMAIFRSSLFMVRIVDTDVRAGPSLILDVLLRAADRSVDRERAKPRATCVGRIMEKVSFDKARVALPTHCFALMQNVSAEEQQRVGLQVDALTNAEMPPRAKSLNLGLVLLNVVGESVLSTAVTNLGDDIQEQRLHLARRDDDIDIWGPGESDRRGA